MDRKMMIIIIAVAAIAVVLVAISLMSGARKAAPPSQAPPVPAHSSSTPSQAPPVAGQGLGLSEGDIPSVEPMLVDLEELGADFEVEEVGFEISF